MGTQLPPCQPKKGCPRSARGKDRQTLAGLPEDPAVVEEVRFRPGLGTFTSGLPVGPGDAVSLSHFDTRGSCL